MRGIIMKKIKTTDYIEEITHEMDIKSLIAHLQEIADKIDNGPYTEITVTPQWEDDYGSYRSYLEICGVREETDKEYEKRQEFLLFKKTQREEEERQELERLKNKYESEPNG